MSKKMEYVEPKSYFTKEMKKILDEGKKEASAKKPAEKKPASKKK